MPFSKLIVVLPCHGLEDFPVHVAGSQASSLLACWTALWHPSLIAMAGGTPRWESIDFPTNDYQNALVVIPSVVGDRFEELISNLQESDRPQLITGATSRDEILQHASVAEIVATDTTAEIAKDFFSLSYASLQIQLMTRQLRYSSTLDLEEMSRRANQAAQSAVAGNTETAKTELQRCFDLLLEEKTKYYPVPPQLLDLILMAPTTLGKSIDRQLTLEHKQNLLLTGNLVQLLKTKNQTAFDLVRRKIETKELHIVGGMQNEIRSNAMSVESTLRQLTAGRETLHQEFEVTPTTFARRTAGFNSHWPAILKKFGYDGTSHYSMDESKVPQGSSPSVLWEGSDATTIGALTTPPINAADSAGFLGLGVTIGQELDSAHYANTVFAHWPARTCDYFEDLIRSQAFGSPLGRFIDFQTYLETAYDPGYSERYTPDEYQAEHLKQDVATGASDANPISRFTHYWRLYYRAMSAQNLITMLSVWGRLDRRSAEDILERLSAVNMRIDELPQFFSDEEREKCQNEIAAIQQDVVHEASMLPTADDGEITIVNSLGFGTRFNVEDMPDVGPQKNNPPIAFADNGKLAVDVPAFGCVTVHTNQKTDDGLAGEPSMVDGLAMKNEYFTVKADEATGGIRTVNLHSRRRTNLLTQQLAYRLAKTREQHGHSVIRGSYSKMVADKVNVEALSRIEARMISNGKLVDGETLLAEFEQQVTVRRGSSRIDVRLQLEPLVPPKPLAWQSYLCSRIAWADESAEIFRGDMGTRARVIENRFCAPNFVQVDDGESSVTLLPHGLPYHKRSSSRMLDTLLQVAGEQQQNFEFSIAINDPLPMRSATVCLTPYHLLSSSAENQSVSGWIFYVNCKNVIVTSTRPKFDQQGAICGATLRLQETEGQGGKLKIACPFQLRAAESVDFVGQLEQDLDTENKTAICDFHPHQIFQIELHW